MSDQQQAEKLARINAALARKNVRPDCPACGNTAWAVLEDASTRPAQLFVFENGAFAVPPPHVQTYVFSCTNCGFLRAHQRSVIDEAGGAAG